MGRTRNVSSDLHRPASGSRVRPARVSKKVSTDKPKRPLARARTSRSLVEAQTEDPLVIERFDSVWEALGFSPEESASLETRSELMNQIEDIIKKNRWIQATAAKHCGVSQPRINDLLRGRIDKFSIDALVNIAACLGQKIHIQLEAA